MENIHSKDCQSGEILSNLVTLPVLLNYYKILMHDFKGFTSCTYKYIPLRAVVVASWQSGCV